MFKEDVSQSCILCETANQRIAALEELVREIIRNILYYNLDLEEIVNCPEVRRIMEED